MLLWWFCVASVQCCFGGLMLRWWFSVVLVV